MFYIQPHCASQWFTPQWPTITLSSFFRYRSFCSCLSSYVLGNVRHHGPFSLRGRRCLRDRKKGGISKIHLAPLEDPQSRPPNLILFHSLFFRKKIWSKKTFHSLTNVNEKNYLCSIQKRGRNGHLRREDVGPTFARARFAHRDSSNKNEKTSWINILSWEVFDLHLD